MDLWSDDYSSSSDSENEEEPEEIYCPRQLDYWALEAFMDNCPPPPVLAYLEQMSLVTIRDCIVRPVDKLNVYDIMSLSSARNWLSFWRNGQDNPDANLTFEDIDTVGQYCMRLCEQCEVYDMHRVRACMKRMLRPGRY